MSSDWLQFPAVRLVCKVPVAFMKAAPVSVPAQSGKKQSRWSQIFTHAKVILWRCKVSYTHTHTLGAYFFVSIWRLLVFPAHRKRVIIPGWQVHGRIWALLFTDPLWDPLQHPGVSSHHLAAWLQGESLLNILIYAKMRLIYLVDPSWWLDLKEEDTRSRCARRKVEKACQRRRVL